MCSLCFCSPQGCGAFGAEVPLKTLIQLLAASLSRRSLRYFTFASEACDPLPALLRVIQSRQPTIANLYQACMRYHPQRAYGRTHAEYIADLLDGVDDKKQAEWLAQRDREAAIRRQQQQPQQQSQSSLPFPPSSAAAPTPSPAARHSHAALSAAADSLEFDFEDPITDFPTDDEDLGYDSEEEKARQAEIEH